MLLSQAPDSQIRMPGRLQVRRGVQLAQALERWLMRGCMGRGVQGAAGARVEVEVERAEGGERHSSWHWLPWRRLGSGG